MATPGSSGHQTLREDILGGGSAASETLLTRSAWLSLEVEHGGGPRTSSLAAAGARGRRSQAAEPRRPSPRGPAVSAVSRTVGHGRTACVARLPECRLRGPRVPSLGTAPCLCSRVVTSIVEQPP